MAGKGKKKRERKSEREEVDTQLRRITRTFRLTSLPGFDCVSNLYGTRWLLNADGMVINYRTRMIDIYCCAALAVLLNNIRFRRARRHGTQIDRLYLKTGSAINLDGTWLLNFWNTSGERGVADYQQKLAFARHFFSPSFSPLHQNTYAFI